MSENEYVPQPDDDEPMVWHFESSMNITFGGKADSGITKGEWRQMSEEEKHQFMDDYIYDLVSISTNAD